MSDLKFKDHAWYLWHFIKNREIRVWWPKKGSRTLGPHWTYYDGPIYAFGFWFFTVSAYYFREDEDRDMRYQLISLLEKLGIRKVK